MTEQLTLFQLQPDDFPEDAPAPVYRADPDKVRARLHKIIGQAREAATLPWERSTVSLYRTIVPQMTGWLPDDEAAQLRAEFAAEMDRLDPPPACPECVRP